ncbi:MAG: CBS domain-containing protein, partial [Desulfonatronovibrionaceae bacterium]
MNIELVEIQNFLGQQPPFDTLPENALSKAASSLEISYFRAGSTIITHGDPIHHLYIVRSGSIELFRRSGELYNRLAEGAIFGEMGLLMNNKARFTAEAVEDSLVYCLDAAVFYEFCDQYNEFYDYVEVDNSTRLRQAVTTVSYGNDLTTSKLRNLLSREAVFLNADDTIQQAARTMADENVSAVLVLDPDSPDESEELDQPEGQFVGILTDRDLCIRVLARGIPADRPIREVMSTELISLDLNDYVFEAMLTMLRRNIHHLPVLRNKRPVGVVEITDIISYESKSSLLLVNNTFLQQSVEDLARLSDQVNTSFVRMVNESANSHMVGTAMSVIGRSFIQRLAELGEQE